MSRRLRQVLLALALATLVAPSVGHAANVRANDPATEAAGTSNANPVVAADGPQVIVAWNEGTVSGSWAGFAYSSNGGLTFTDGGSAPYAYPLYDTGDPAVATDHAGNFYLVHTAEYYNFETGIFALVISRGTFAGASFAWGPPTTVVSFPWSYPVNPDVFHQPSIAVDPTSGALIVAWTRGLGGGLGGSRIEYARSVDQGATWTAPSVLAAGSPPTYVRWSSVAIGPDHEVEVLYVRHTNDNGPTFLQTRRSMTGGVSFAAESTLPTPAGGALLNVGSGPPGSAAFGGLTRPSLAIDGSIGPRRGRTFVAWEAGVDVSGDAPGSLGTGGEAEPNASALSANPITIGQSVTGTLPDGTDVDWFAFTGTQGQTLVASILSTTAYNGGPDGRLSLYAGSGTSGERVASSRQNWTTGHIVFTLPATGTYWLVVTGVLYTSGPATQYRIDTAWHTPSSGDIGRDARDIVLMSSANGTNWDPARTIVNDDPPRFDNAVPEVAVDNAGRVHVSWYDHRDDTAEGLLTNVYHAWSDDGGATFSPAEKLNDGPATNYNLVGSPGEHAALVSNGSSVYAAFHDGRNGTVDAWTQVIQGAALSVDDPGLPGDGPAFAITGVGPNPAVGRVVITLALRYSADVRLTVLDLQGRRIATLIEGALPAGRHPVAWDGERLAAGLYFLSLEAPGVHDRRRIVIAR